MVVGLHPGAQRKATLGPKEPISYGKRSKGSAAKIKAGFVLRWRSYVQEPTVAFCFDFLLMISLVKTISICGLLLILALNGCGPTTIQGPSQFPDAKKAAESSTSEINIALAKIGLSNSAHPGDYRIGAEDLLQITVFNLTEDAKGTPKTVSVRVSHEGSISLPLIGDLKVAGLTPAALERQLKKEYGEYLYNPQVGVLVTEYRQRVSVIGAVQKPGTIDLTGPKTVIDILGMAGGLNDRAGTRVHIHRQGANGPESYVIDLLAFASNASLINANNAGLITMPVQSGDVIEVPPAGTFFVDGAVKTAGSYPLGRHYSLTQALAVAGGVNPDLNSSDITIFRRNGASGVQSINVDLNDVIARSAPDPQIEADDVIMVPINSLKYVYQRIFGQLLGWGTSIAGAAAISGT
jgi:polysaccharide biosynthesis/export protein